MARFGSGGSGGSGGSVTPLSMIQVVDPNGGNTDGAYSGAQAWSTVTDAVGASTTGQLILLSPSIYTEGVVPVVDKSLRFTGQCAVRDDTTLPDLQIRSPTLGTLTLGLMNVSVNLDLDFTVTGGLFITARNAALFAAEGTNVQIEAFDSIIFGLGGTNPITEMRADNCEIGSSVAASGPVDLQGCRVAGSVTAGALTLQGCRIGADLSAAGITVSACRFLGGLTITGSLTIDASSYLDGIGAGVTFPATTTIVGLPSRAASATGVAVADDATPVEIVTMDFPSSQAITGYTAAGFADLTIVPDDPGDTPDGTVTIEDPLGNTSSIAWGPIPAGDSVFVPFALPGQGAGAWHVSVTVTNATGPVTVNNAILSVTPQ